MAEYRIHCKHCGYEGQANSRWIPFVQVEKRGQDCPHCGRPTLLEPWCRLGLKRPCLITERSASCW